MDDLGVRGCLRPTRLGAGLTARPSSCTLTDAAPREDVRAISRSLSGSLAGITHHRISGGCSCGMPLAPWRPPALEAPGQGLTASAKVRRSVRQEREERIVASAISSQGSRGPSGPRPVIRSGGPLGHRISSVRRATRGSNWSTSPRRSATAHWIRRTSGKWLPGLRPGRLDLMHATVPTYCMYGIEAIPTDVVMGPGGVRVVERETGRVLAIQQARMLGGPSNLGRRRSAPKTMTTRRSYLSCP
jgi:hypothetical protein